MIKNDTECAIDVFASSLNRWCTTRDDHAHGSSDTITRLKQEAYCKKTGLFLNASYEWYHKIGKRATNNSISFIGKMGVVNKI